MFGYGLLKGIDVQLLPVCVAAPPGTRTNGLLNLNAMFDATAAPPAARIRAAATSTATVGCDLNLSMSFASFDLGYYGSLFHTTRGSRITPTTAIYVQNSVCQHKKRFQGPP